MAIRYPSEFTAGPSTDYIEIKAIRRDYSSETERYIDAGLGTIILNVPQKIVENYTQSWANTKLGEMGPYLGTRAANPAGVMSTDFMKRFVEQALLNKASEVLQQFGGENLNQNTLLSGASGIILNPNMEVLYDGPQFRQYNFQFALFTKSEKDAKAIYEIANFFKLASVPSKNASVNRTAVSSLFSDTAVASVVTGGAAAVAGVVSNVLSGKAAGVVNSIFNNIVTPGAIAGGAIGTGAGAIFSGDSRFITQPPFIQLRFRRGSEDHPYVGSLLPAAITALSVDYTPTGNYTVLNNFGQEKQATTVATTITMTLTELKNVFSEDIPTFTSGGTLVGPGGTGVAYPI